MMQPGRYFAFTLLCSLSFLSSVLSIQCNETQYAWPVERPRFCCNKCLPGNRLVRRFENECQTQCEPCKGDRYIDTYSVMMSCNICENCDKTNMEYKSHCNSTHNAVCRCKTGYECKDQPCKQCVPTPTTTKPPPLPQSTTALKPILWTPHKPLRDTEWFLVIIALLSAGTAFVVVTKIRPFLRWIRSKHGYLLAEIQIPTLARSEDEEVSKPVQEACGKCDQPLV